LDAASMLYVTSVEAQRLLALTTAQLSAAFAQKWFTAI